MKTLVLGASPNPDRYSYKACKMLQQYGHEVVAVGNREGEVQGIVIQKNATHYDDIHTITLYLNASNQKQYYSFILNSKPQRVIFNPGTENSELEKLLVQEGIQVVHNCTLIMLGSGSYS